MCCERGMAILILNIVKRIFLRTSVVPKVMQFNITAMLSSCTLASNVLLLSFYVLCVLAKQISLHISWFMIALLVLSCFFSFFTFSLTTFKVFVFIEIIWQLMYSIECIVYCVKKFHIFKDKHLTCQLSPLDIACGY